MIQIHRSKRLVIVGDKPVKLTSGEHNLMITLGIMDNRLAEHDVLLDVMRDGREQAPGDMDALRWKISRLRVKIGAEHLQTRRHFGYVLAGDVRFVG